MTRGEAKERGVDGGAVRAGDEWRQTGGGVRNRVGPEAEPGPAGPARKGVGADLGGGSDEGQSLLRARRGAESPPRALGRPPPAPLSESDARAWRARVLSNLRRFESVRFLIRLGLNLRGFHSACLRFFGSPRTFEHAKSCAPSPSCPPPRTLLHLPLSRAPGSGRAPHRTPPPRCSAAPGPAEGAVRAGVRNGTRTGESCREKAQNGGNGGRRRRGAAGGAE